MDCKIRMIRLRSFPVYFLEFIEPITAIGDWHSTVQHYAGLTHKSQPSAASGYQAGFVGLRPKPRQRGLFVKSPLWNPEKQRLTFIVWIFSICSQDIKDHRTCRLFAFGVAMRSFSASRDQPTKHGLRLQAAIRLYSWGAAPYPAKGDFL